MTDIDEEALDWQGEPVDCAVCDHRDLLREGRCQLRRACVHDRYASRVHRFFSQTIPIRREPEEIGITFETLEEKIYEA